jgi:hypothetical protein
MVSFSRGSRSFTICCGVDGIPRKACFATIGNLGGIIGPQIYGVWGKRTPEREGETDYKYAHVTMSFVAMFGATLMHAFV